MGIQARGFSGILSRPDMEDLGRRWIEQHYILKRQNPYDVAFRVRALENGEPPPVTMRNAKPDPEIGIPTDVDYPPWSYFSGFVFFWPDAKLVRVWFALCNLVSLVVISWCLIRMSRGYGPTERAFLVASVAAFSAIGFTI